MKFVNQNNLRLNCKVMTVIDSYPQEPTTKDSTHLHRTQKTCPKIRIANNIVLDLTVFGDDTDLIALLLHNTKGMELNKLFFHTKKWHWAIALLAACIRKKPFMRHILSLYSVSGCNTTSRKFMKDKNVLRNP